MAARIFKPSRTAMQSGAANTKQWMLEYEPEQPREIKPLMGWTASGDMKQQLRLSFGTQEEAVGYCEKRGIHFQLFEPQNPTHKKIAYADNFAFKRIDQWTH
jgi:hypothetical protein